jgi:hypothetical protein
MPVRLNIAINEDIYERLKRVLPAKASPVSSTTPFGRVSNAARFTARMAGQSTGR